MPRASIITPVVRDVAMKLQELIDNFRSENGLLSEKQKQRPNSFSYEDVLRKVKYDVQNIEKEIKYIVALAMANTKSQTTSSTSRNEDVTIAELVRQTRRSVEVDTQRIVSRWLREFIEQHKNEDVEETFKTFTRILSSTSSATPNSEDENNNNNNNSSKAVSSLSSSPSSSSPSFSVLNIAAPQLLDASLQWLLPRSLKRYSKAKEIILRLKNNQQKFLNMTKLILEEGTTHRKQQEERERLLAHSRVALSDFTSQLEYCIKELMSMGEENEKSTNNNDGQQQASNLATHRIGTKMNALLLKYHPQMRENLSMASSIGSLHQNHNHQASAASASSTTFNSANTSASSIINTSSHPASDNQQQQQQHQQQQARRALTELIRSLDETSIIIMNESSSHPHHQKNNNNDTSNNEFNDKKDLISFLNEIDDDVVVTIQASHLEKERENQERDFFAKINSSTSVSTESKISSKNKKSSHKRSKEENDDSEDDDENDSEIDEKEGNISYFDENGQFNLSGTRRPAKSGDETSSKSITDKLRSELSKAHQIIEKANRVGADREVVIQKLQSNLTRLSSLVEHFSSNGNNNNSKPPQSQQHLDDNDMMMMTTTTMSRQQPHHSHHIPNPNPATVSVHVQHELEMLRSQVAVQDERIHHMSCSLEERTLREESLKREVESLQASESILKGELTYQQAALRACNDDLIVAQTVLFEMREQLHKCEVSRKQFVDCYQRLREIFIQDRRYATELYQQNQHMSQQLDQSVPLVHVEELLSLNITSGNI